MTPDDLFAKHQAWAEGLAKNLHRKHLPPSFDVDEIVNEALLALWKCAFKFDASFGVPFLAFAHPYVQNACFMAVRRREWTERTMEELPAVVEASEAKRPDRQVIQQQTRDEIYAEMQKLPLEHRRVLEALFWQGISLSMLAQNLNMSTSATARIRDEAFAALRENARKKAKRAELRRGVAMVVVHED